MTGSLIPHCNICGLMCAINMYTLRNATGDPTDCSRLAQWHSQNSLLKVAIDDSSLSPMNSELRKLLENLQLGKRTLIWLDACDVQTARSAVHLAKNIGATVHIGESAGSHALKSVMASEGWMGTTLSEVAARAGLVITLGDSIIDRAPLIAKRFFRSSTRATSPYWLHLSANETSRKHFDPAHIPHEFINVPREEWFNWFTQLTLKLHPDGPDLENAFANAPALESASAVANALRSTEHSVWLWDVDELHCGTDELIIRRLLTIARTLAETSRCSLLPLEMNVGRTTAEETLLWLTGCTTTVSFTDGKWQSPMRYSGYSLEEWQASFHSILIVSNLHNSQPLPNLRATLTLQTNPALRGHELQVKAVGLTDSGHLFRGDRGTVHFLPAIKSIALPSAATVLTYLAQQQFESKVEANNAAGT